MSKINNLHFCSLFCFQYIKLITLIFACLLITACTDNDTKYFCHTKHAPISNKNKNMYLNAAKDGNTELVKNYMFGATSDWGVVDENGQTVLILASAKGYIDIVKLFTIDERRCFSTDINHKDNNNKTALIVARENGHLNVVDLLIRAGATESTSVD